VRRARLGPLHEGTDRFQQGALFAVAAQEELARVEIVPVEIPAADEEGIRARAAAQPGGLEVEEQEPWGGRERGAAEKPWERVEGARRGQGVALDRFAPVDVGRGVAAVHDEAAAASALDHFPAKHVPGGGGRLVCRAAGGEGGLFIG
jgi:hypothetical protein